MPRDYTQKTSDSQVVFRHPVSGQTFYYDVRKFQKFSLTDELLFKNDEQETIIDFHFDVRILISLFKWIDEGPHVLLMPELAEFLELAERWQLFKIIEEVRRCIITNFNLYLREIGYVAIFRVLRKYFPQLESDWDLAHRFYQISLHVHGTSGVAALTYEELDSLSQLVGSYNTLLDAWCAEEKNRRILCQLWFTNVEWKDRFLWNLTARKIKIVRQLKNYEILDTVLQQAMNDLERERLENAKLTKKLEANGIQLDQREKLAKHEYFSKYKSRPLRVYAPYHR